LKLSSVAEVRSVCNDDHVIDLLVMRHAKSAWDTDAASDFDRPLANRGARDAHRMADWLAQNDLEPDGVLSSSALRARMTVQPVIDRFEISPSRVQFRDELYLADATSWIDAIADTVFWLPLLCGHNPGLDELVSHLSSKPPPLSANRKLMTTASIAHLHFEGWDEVENGSGQLVNLVRPRELAR